MNREEVINNDKEYIVNLYKRFDLVFDKAKGSTVYDINGREYIDFSSGIGCASLGYSDEGWVKAVEAQLEKFQHTSNLFYHEPGV
ncbi:MAG: aminotransferase class III-fold pyridoxal phosphate-dependent enzyme, partial [Anaerovoracaceae bacterium]